MLKKRLVVLLLGLLFLYQHVSADTYLKITPQELNQLEKTLDDQQKLISNYQEENERLMEITKNLNKQYKKLEIENSVIKIGSLTILTAFSAYYIYRNLN